MTNTDEALGNEEFEFLLGNNLLKYINKINLFILNY